MRNRVGCWTRHLATGALTLLVLILWVPGDARAAGQWDFLLAPESACPGQTNPVAPTAVQAETMICMHNWARAQSGLPALREARQLRLTSSRKAHDIRRCQQFSHNACGRDAFYWFRKLGFMHGSYIAGENLAFGPSAEWSVRETMSRWLNSDLHRPVLLDPRFDEVGMTLLTARFAGRPGTAIWVAHFGHQQAPAAATSSRGAGSIYSELVKTLSSSY